LTTPADSQVPTGSQTAAKANAEEKAAIWRPGMPWIPAAVVLAGGLVVGDSLHGSWSGAVMVAAAAAGWWWLGRGNRRIKPTLPSSWSGWIERCEGLLGQFERLEPAEAPSPAGFPAGSPADTPQQQRRRRLQELRDRQGRERLQVSLAGVTVPQPSLQPALLRALRAPLPLTLHWGNPLPARSPDWRWPELFEQSDLMLFWLVLPLRAADLRWLESLPTGQPVGLLVTTGKEPGLEAHQREELLAELRSQLPADLTQNLIHWSGEENELGEALEPLSRMLRTRGRSLLLQTELRCLENLHAQWQTSLEGLRRRRLEGLVRRTQWLVAAGVVAAPLPSVDVLVLAVANGLMLRDMAELWDCPWQMEQLREAAIELAKAALALGVTEWTSQALLAVMRLEGSTWLVGGAMQALSAAYLTRVVAHAMADVLALSNGVPEVDLQAIKRQAPLLVARAAEAERLDWKGFLSQGKTWLQSSQGPWASASG
jgi:hypothetical protein